MRRRTPDEVVQHILATAVRDKKTGCLVSSLRKDKKGYARIRFVDEIRAHVVVYFKGKLPPPGQRPHVLHTCDNRACVEEDHLYPGTNKQNIADKIRRDRSGKKLNIAKARRVKTMLAQGHKQTYIARMMGITQTTVHYIKKGRHWAHVQNTRGPDSVHNALESGT